MMKDDNTLHTDRQAVPLYKRVQNLIIEKVNNGILKPGDALPSSREMALQLEVSRKTVVKALDLLVARGVLTSKDRVGIFVATKHVASTKDIPTASVSDIVVNDGFPDTSLIPFREYTRTYRQIFNRQSKWQRLVTNDTKGYIGLRQAICEVLGRLVALPVSADEICIVNGSQMGMYLVANAVLSPGDDVVMEMPGYPLLRKTLETARLNVHHIPVDADGLDVDRLETLCQQAVIKVVWTTPRFQYPTTVTLSMQRRKKLCELSMKYGFIIVEDDFGFVYNFSKKYFRTVSSMLPKSHYIYIGNFSKVFTPSARLGYIVASREVTDAIADYRMLIDLHGDTVIEKSIYEIYYNGLLQRHMRNSAKVYKDRLREVSREIRHILGDKVIYRKPHGGLAIWIAFTSTSVTEPLLRDHLAANHVTAPVFTLPDGTVGIRIGFVSISHDNLVRFLEILALLP